eukprot:scaffold19380_cov107-Isochrysis_galbana.AAC.10
MSSRASGLDRCRLSFPHPVPAQSCAGVTSSSAACGHRGTWHRGHRRKRLPRACMRVYRAAQPRLPVPSPTAKPKVQAPHARCWLDAAVWAPRARSISLTARHARAARRTPRRSWLVGCAPCSVASGDPSRRHHHVPCRGAARVRGVHTKEEGSARAVQRLCDTLVSACCDKRKQTPSPVAVL